MKKLFSAIVAAMMAIPSFAQFSSGGFDLDKESLYYGIRFGAMFSNLSGNTQTDASQGITYRTDLGMKAGLGLGGVIGLRLSQTAPVFLESGLYFTQRGAKGHNIDVTYNNLEIPLIVKYGIKVSDNIAILPFAGMYFAHAIAGKTKQRHLIVDDKGETKEDGTTEKVGTFAEESARTGGLNRNNIGVKLGCGFEYNKLYLEAGYQIGLNNIAKGGSNERLSDLSARSNALFVNVGVNF